MFYVGMFYYNGNLEEEGVDFVEEEMDWYMSGIIW